MRDVAPRGDAIVKSSQSLTVTLTDVVAVTIDVPPGCVAIVTLSMLLAPSSNTVTASFQVDGLPIGPSPIGTTTLLTFAPQASVPSGRHRISGLAAGSTAAGSAQNCSLSWVIVRKDGSR